MPIPTTREGLIDAGYEFSGEGRCRSCDAELEWWISPKGNKMPMCVVAVRKDGSQSPLSPVIRYERVSHFSNCPAAASFRKK